MPYDWKRSWTRCTSIEVRASGPCPGAAEPPHETTASPLGMPCLVIYVLEARAMRLTPAVWGDRIELVQTLIIGCIHFMIMKFSHPLTLLPPQHLRQVSFPLQHVLHVSMSGRLTSPAKWFPSNGSFRFEQVVWVVLPAPQCLVMLSHCIFKDSYRSCSQFTCWYLSDGLAIP